MPRPPSKNTEKARDAQVGILLRTYRESHPNRQGGRGISQSELLRLMRSINPYYGRISSHVAVSKWESGDTPPTQERIETFGRALELSEEEIEGLILLAGLNMEQQESRALACPHCGEETVTERVHRDHSHTGAELYSKAATRTRKCISCGRTAESTERWAHDPVEVGNSKMGRILGQIQTANDRIRRTLMEANKIDSSQPEEEDVPECQPPSK